MDIPVTRLSDLGAPQRGAFALTFDDGPEEPWTTAVLDCLEALGVPATFFVLGSKVAGQERTLRRMVELGCGIEVHGWEHVPMTQQEPAQLAADLDRTSQAIGDATGH